MAAASIWLLVAQLILGNYKWMGTCSHAHRMSSDSFHEDCEPRPLFHLRQELSAPYHELDDELHTETHTA
jgi:hypothetical protein